MNEPSVCARCDKEYGLRDGMDPSKYCDECAQILTDELETRCELDKAEIIKLRKILYRAVRELEYARCAETLSLVQSAEGNDIIDTGMKILGVPDLSLDELPQRLLKA